MCDVFFVCVCVLFLGECAQKKKRDKKRARIFRSSKTTSKTHYTPARAPFCVCREGVVLVVLLVLRFCWRRERGEERERDARLLFYIRVKIFDAIFFLSSNVKSAARGEEETKSSSSSSYNVVSLASK